MMNTILIGLTSSLLSALPLSGITLPIVPAQVVANAQVLEPEENLQTASVKDQDYGCVKTDALGAAERSNQPPTGVPEQPCK